VLTIHEIAHRLTDAQRKRGLAYFQEGHVHVLEDSEHRVRATVYGGEAYSVDFRFTRGRWWAECTCPACEREFACKHEWAVYLAVRNNHPGEEFAAEVEPPTLPGRSRKRAASLQQLDRELRALLSRPDAVSANHAIELRFVLHVVERDSEQWSVLGIQIARRKNGRLTPFQPSFPSPLQQKSLGEDEQRILAMLGNATWSWRTKSAGEGGREIPRVLEPTILELAARTGRLRLATETTVRERPLLFDDGPPWTLELHLKKGDIDATLTGLLTRGEESLELADCDEALAGGLIVHDDRLARVDWRGAGGWVPSMRKPGGMRAPFELVHRLVNAIQTAAREVRIHAADFVEHLTAKPTGIVQLATSLDESGAIPVEIQFQYGGERRRALDPESSTWIQRPGKLIWLRRDPAEEERLLGEFEVAGGDRTPTEDGSWTAVVPAERLPDLVADLSAHGWLVEAEGARVRAGAESKAGIASGIDWFDIETSIAFDGLSPDMPELLRAAREDRRMVRLGDGTVGLLPTAWLARLQFALRIGDVEGDVLRVPATRAWLLDAWVAEHKGRIDVDTTFSRVRENLRRCAEPLERPEPAGFVGELRPYQREGLGWLHFLGEASIGGILADDMGLGKTIEVLATLLERRATARGPALVVAPLSVLFNWEREAERFAPGLKRVLHHGPQRAKTADRFEGADLVVTSHATMRLDIEMLKEVNFDCAVIDEAQAIKNEKSQGAKAARLLKADLKLALTGTPVENHLGELVSILRYTNPELVEGSRLLKDVLSGGRADPTTAGLLARAVRPFMLRRTKEAVARELPAKTEQVVTVELDASARREYEELRARIAAKILDLEEQLGLERIGIHVLEAMLRLRQAACHPGLIDRRRVAEPSAKLDVLLERLAEIAESGHKALVFSQFTSFLAIVRARLDALGMRYEYLDGSTKKRAEPVRAFQEDPAIPLFLISLKAGGSGLNLTAADYVFLLDPWWNPAAEAQAIDRTHRIGQTRPVTAYRLIARDTIEERVLELQERKREVANALFSGASTSLRDLTRADLARLFT